ncbi:SdpI family protein [Candidatus Woesearchaeota archaeon]|jgi:uncharacterized membrane protein|nr:SdpI family protein [Candidatus Woesearchaeota archaeon]MBT7402218.1 SdpI family protein [Candidatus Woesearchaeota archaeon]
MKLTKYDWASIGIVVLLFVVSFYLYPSLPEEIPTHWNAEGKVDGYGSKEMIFLFPVISFLIYGLFLVLPKIAVFKKNIRDFKHLESMKFMLVIMFAFLFLATVLAITNYYNRIILMILPIIGLLFFYLGYIMPAMKRNFFIGIRTPWTLADDFVWKQTHALGGKLFMILGILFFLLIFIDPQYLVYLILIKVIGVVVILFSYSYWVWHKQGKKHM